MAGVYQIPLPNPHQLAGRFKLYNRREDKRLQLIVVDPDRPLGQQTIAEPKTPEEAIAFAQARVKEEEEAGRGE